MWFRGTKRLRRLALAAAAVGIVACCFLPWDFLFRPGLQFAPDAPHTERRVLRKAYDAGCMSYAASIYRRDWGDQALRVGIWFDCQRFAESSSSPRQKQRFLLLGYKWGWPPVRDREMAWLELEQLVKCALIDPHTLEGQIAQYEILTKADFGTLKDDLYVAVPDFEILQMTLNSCDWANDSFWLYVTGFRSKDDFLKYCAWTHEVATRTATGSYPDDAWAGLGPPPLGKLGRREPAGFRDFYYWARLGFPPVYVDKKDY
jgi:hypothetical protein